MIVDDYDLNHTAVARSVPSSHVVDPFAASVVSGWIPPEYERRSPGNLKTGKRALAEPSLDQFGAPLGSAKKMRFNYRENPAFESIFAVGIGDDFSNSDTVCRPSREEEVWEGASTRVFDGNGNIDLSNHNLTYISRKFVEDLENMYIPPDSLNNFRSLELSTGIASRPFARSLTAPADVEESGSYHFASDARRMARERAGRVRTIADISLGLPKGQIALYLMANEITKLPKELFNLQKLTILSIRHNKLTYLPPEIKYLTNLHTLNVAYNQLRYLPSEMLQMSLSTLIVHPNPFLEPATSALASRVSLPGRSVSQPIHPLPRIIPLVEVCLRKLLSPTLTQHDDTILNMYYELPLQEYEPRVTDPPPLLCKKRVSLALPTHIRKVLDVCAPGSVYDYGDEGAAKGSYGDDEFISGLGYCPGKDCGIFVRHAEERFTWESKIANVEVGSRVPVRWRGCNWGCLDIMDEGELSRAESGECQTEAAVHVMNLDLELGFDD